ncbi:PH domain-containing protein [Candidatus Curtissbacteria bacterium]|nr:PH domain-containing protein [Candidatus Curtissbacteria bacterium]
MSKKSVGVKIHHINIRQSISIILLKLVLLELLSASGFLFLYFSFSNELVVQSMMGLFENFFGWVFLLLVFAKIYITIYIILDWLNMYYEINGEYIYTRKGVIWTTEQKFAIANFGDVTLEQNLMGRIFNFGNIKIFDTQLKKDFLMYLVHNPNKYYEILSSISPSGDKEKKIVRQKFSSDIDL